MHREAQPGVGGALERERREEEKMRTRKQEMLPMTFKATTKRGCKAPSAFGQSAAKSLMPEGWADDESPLP